MDIRKDIVMFDGDYSTTVFTSMLYEMFSKHTEAIAEYIKPSREFWYFDDRLRYRKLKVTYVRSGVVFFIFDDEPDTEHAWFISSFNVCSLFAAQIFPYEIGRILSKWFDGADKEFPEICKQCKWNDCHGQIKVDVIWPDEDVINY